MSVGYDFLVEEVDRESGDILDTGCWDRAVDMFRQMRRPLPAGVVYHYGVVRDPRDDALEDRQWAYAQADGSLPDQFDGGAKLPKRIRVEFDAARNSTQGES